MVPYHTIAFSQQKLRAALRRTVEHDPPLGYGFVVHARRQNERPTLGLITLCGESLPLNSRLITALETRPLWLFGHARVTFSAGERVTRTEDNAIGSEDHPLTSLFMHIATFDANTGVTQNLVQVEAVVKAETLVQPLLVVTHSRPPAWPL